MKIRRSASALERLTVVQLLVKAATAFRRIEAQGVQLAGGMQKAVLRRVGNQCAWVHQRDRLAQLAVPGAIAQLAALEAVER